MGTDSADVSLRVSLEVGLEEGESLDFLGSLDLIVGLPGAFLPPGGRVATRNWGIVEVWVEGGMERIFTLWLTFSRSFRAIFLI